MPPINHQKVDTRSYNLKLDDKDGHALAHSDDEEAPFDPPLPNTSICSIFPSASRGQREDAQHSGSNRNPALPTITGTSSSSDVGAVSTRGSDQLPSTKSMRSLTVEDHASFLIGSSNSEWQKKRVETWHSTVDFTAFTDSRTAEPVVSTSISQRLGWERATSQPPRSHSSNFSDSKINRRTLVRKDLNDGGSAIVVIDVIALVILVLAAKLIIIRALLRRRKRQRLLQPRNEVPMRDISMQVGVARGPVPDEELVEPNPTRSDDDNQNLILRNSTHTVFPAAPPTTPVSRYSVSRYSARQSHLGRTHLNTMPSVSAVLSVPNSPIIASPANTFLASASDTRSILSRNTSYTSNKTAKYLSNLSMLRLSNSNAFSSEEAALSDTHSGVLSRSLSKSSLGAMSRTFSTSSSSSGRTMHGQTIPEVPTLPPLTYQLSGDNALKASFPLELNQPGRPNMI